MSDQSSEHGAQVIRWALRIWGNGKARSWSHAFELAGTYAGESKPKRKPKRKRTTEEAYESIESAHSAHDLGSYHSQSERECA